MLENRGVKATAKAKNKLEFLDATTLVDADGKPLAKDAIADKLKAYDCVVFGGSPRINSRWPTCRSSTRSSSTLSDFRFDPFGKMPASAKCDDNVQTIYTGVVPVVYKVKYRTLLDSLLTSTYWAFISIALCLMVLLRCGPLRPWNLGFRAGLVAMLPNMFPLLIVFGAIGWSGIEVNIGSMMTASIAIGVAVDDTIHYLEFFRKEMLSGKSRCEAIIVSYQHCGSAIIETMLIGGFGLSVFAFSTFTPTQRFGSMMLCMLLSVRQGN